MLGIHPRQVNIAGVGEGLADGLRGDLVELHSMDGLVVGAIAQGADQVPGDGLALAVGISGQVDFRGGPGLLAQVPDHLFPLGRDNVVGSKVVLDIHAQSVLGQVADVADGRADGVAWAEELAHGAGLGWRLDDDELGPVAHGGQGLATLGDDGVGRLIQAGVAGRLPHFEHGRPAHGAGTSRGRLPPPGVDGFRVIDLTFGFTFQAVSNNRVSHDSPGVGQKPIFSHQN